MSIVNEPQIRSIIERVERLHGERKSISDDISEVYKEAKANGFDVPALKEVIKIRAADPDKRSALEQTVDLYLSAIGGA